MAGAGPKTPRRPTTANSIDFDTALQGEIAMHCLLVAVYQTVLAGGEEEFCLPFPLASTLLARAFSSQLHSSPPPTPPGPCRRLHLLWWLSVFLYPSDGMRLTFEYTWELSGRPSTSPQDFADELCEDMARLDRRHLGGGRDKKVLSTSIYLGRVAGPSMDRKDRS